MARLSSAQPTAGTGYELDAIAAVVLGGTSLAGGKGRIVGTLIGALILGFLNNGLNLLGVSSYYQMIVKGGDFAGGAGRQQKAVITTTGHLEYEHEKTGYPGFRCCAKRHRQCECDGKRHHRAGGLHA
nr:hypothetical protein [Escherichia coli]